MRSNIKELIDIATSSSLTYEQKHHNLANAAERLVDPIEVLGYRKKDVEYVEKDFICELNEGFLPYRPRYILPDYSLFVEKGCEFLDLKSPKDLDELLDGLLILYKNVPSITSFPVFIGFLDQLIEPFMTDEEKDYIKIKRFLNHIDKTIPDSFCHGDIGPKKTKAGLLILKAVIELENPTPNMSFLYDEDETEDSFALSAIEACLKAAKPSFANYKKYKEDLDELGLASCYNALPLAGGAYTLNRLRLGTIARSTGSLDEFLDKVLPDVCDSMAYITDRRIEFIVEKSNFFETSFLSREGFVKRENFTAMFGIVGLAEASNHFLALEGKNERFGTSARGDEIAHFIMTKIHDIVNNHQAVYSERTGGKYLLHAQVGASISPEDALNTPAHRIPVGEEPVLPLHLTQAGQFHEYFTSGTGDLFAFDQTYLNKKEALLDIIKGAFRNGFRYITTYQENTDLIRVTGYLVKKSQAKKAENNEVVLRNTAILGAGSNNAAHVFSRRTRTNGE